MPKFKKLPKTIAARIEGEGDDQYLIAEEHFETLTSGDGPVKVGIYELVEVREVKQTVISKIVPR